MRMPPNQRKWLDRGQCIWCGDSYISHRDGAQFMEHHEMYARSYNSTLTEGQIVAIQKWADKKDEIYQRVREKLKADIASGKKIGSAVRLAYKL